MGIKASMKDSMNVSDTALNAADIEGEKRLKKRLEHSRDAKTDRSQRPTSK